MTIFLIILVFLSIILFVLFNSYSYVSYFFPKTSFFKNFFIVRGFLFFLSRLSNFLSNWILSTNHKRIAVMYFIFVIIAGFTGLILATIIRLELAYPGQNIIINNAEKYLTIISLHGVVMVFFMIIPVIFGAFGNFLLPTQLGIRDVAFPRLNSFMFWITPSGFVMLLHIILFDKSYNLTYWINYSELRVFLRRRYFFNKSQLLDYKLSMVDTDLSLRLQASSFDFSDLNFFLKSENLGFLDNNFFVFFSKFNFFNIINSTLSVFSNIYCCIVNIWFSSHVFNNAVYHFLYDNFAASLLNISDIITLDFILYNSLYFFFKNLPNTLNSLDFSLIVLAKNSLDILSTWLFFQFVMFSYSAFILEFAKITLLSNKYLLYVCNRLIAKLLLKFDFMELISSIYSFFLFFYSYVYSMFSIFTYISFDSFSYIPLSQNFFFLFYSIKSFANYFLIQSNASLANNFSFYSLPAVRSVSYDFLNSLIFDLSYLLSSNFSNSTVINYKNDNTQNFALDFSLISYFYNSNQSLNFSDFTFNLFMLDSVLSNKFEYAMSVSNFLNLFFFKKEVNLDLLSREFSGFFFKSRSLSNIIDSYTNSLIDIDYLFDWQELHLEREVWRSADDLSIARRHWQLRKLYFANFFEPDTLINKVSIWLPNQLIPGWAFITPYSSRLKFSAIGKVDIALVVVLLASLGSVFSSINYIITYRYIGAPIFKNRKEMRSFFVDGLLVASRMMLLANPALIIGIILLLSDRHFNTSVFDFSGGGDTILFQHLFWFFGHPEVYIIIIPCFGFMNSLLPHYLKKRLSGRLSLQFSMYTIAFMGFAVWGHHMYMVGLANSVRTLYSTMTVMISVPASTKVLHWCVTIINSSIASDVGFLFLISFMYFFVLGGLSGMFLAHIGFDVIFHDTFFVIGHFHVMLAGAAMSCVFAAFYFYFSSIFGVKYCRVFAYLHFFFYVFGQIITLVPMFWLGYAGMPRRIMDYPSAFGGWHSIISSGHILTFMSLIFFLLMIFFSLYDGRASSSRSRGISRLNKKILAFTLESKKIRKNSSRLLLIKKNLSAKK